MAVYLISLIACGLTEIPGISTIVGLLISQRLNHAITRDYVDCMSIALIVCTLLCALSNPLDTNDLLQ